MKPTCSRNLNGRLKAPDFKKERDSGRRCLIFMRFKYRCSINRAARDREFIFFNRETLAKLGRKLMPLDVSHLSEGLFSATTSLALARPFCHAIFSRAFNVPTNLRSSYQFSFFKRVEFRSARDGLKYFLVSW